MNNIRKSVLDTHTHAPHRHTLTCTAKIVTLGDNQN